MGKENSIMTTETATDAKQTEISLSAFIVALIFCVFLAAVFAILTFAGGSLANKIALQNRINPNYAPAASLTRLPGIGMGRAQAIVAYRQEHTGKSERGIIFTDCNDLDKVKGIGRATAEKIKPWLEFK